MDSMRAVDGILYDVFDTVVVQKTVEKAVVDGEDERFSFLLREMSFSAKSLKRGIHSWTEEMKQSKLRSLNLNLKVSDFYRRANYRALLLITFHRVGDDC